MKVIQRQLGHETLQQTLDYIKDLISEQEGEMYLEEATMFATNPEINRSGSMNKVIDFR